jgi:hypothetical protein
MFGSRETFIGKLHATALYCLTDRRTQSSDLQRWHAEARSWNNPRAFR